MELTEDRVTIPERLLRPWMEYWHGRKDASHQWDFYRCKGCRGLVTWRMIKRGGCSCDMAKQLVPARLSLVEKVKILVLPWML